jgi:hypothetical protein
VSLEAAYSGQVRRTAREAESAVSDKTQEEDRAVAYGEIVANKYMLC